MLQAEGNFKPRTLGEQYCIAQAKSRPKETTEKTSGKGKGEKREKGQRQK
jgi:hypothetical protein